MELGFPLKMPKEFATAFKVGDEIKVQFCLETEFETDEEGTVQRSLKDFSLANSMGDLLFRNNLFFREHLHGVYTPSIPLPDLEDFAKCAPADELQELKVSWSQSPFSLRGKQLTGVGGRKDAWGYVP